MRKLLLDLLVKRYRKCKGSKSKRGGENYYFRKIGPIDRLVIEGVEKQTDELSLS